MIYTMTFNPAVDYVVHTGKIKEGQVNRSNGEQIYFGGKGINVSFILNELGEPTTAMGFTAGFTGRAIRDAVLHKGIIADFIHLEQGCSRINVKLNSLDNDILTETEINGQGPEIRDIHMSKLRFKLEKLTEGDTLVLAGSVPTSMPKDIYQRIAERLKGRGVRLAVDAGGELLTAVLKYKPFVIKPNNFELEEIFDIKITSMDDVETHAAMLQEMGAQNVIVSMGASGAFMLDEFGKQHYCPAFKGTVKNSVGAGDAMLAGFLAGVDKGYDYALKLGAAAGGATAFSDGLATKAEIMSLLNRA